MIRRFAARPSPVLLDPDRVRTELGRRLWAAGLGRVADELVALGRECVRLVPTRDARHPPATSFVGGEPDLPDDVDWPVCRGRPQHFLAQIDLAEVHAALPVSPLPAAGRLLFFRHAERSSWSEHQVYGADAASILYVEPGRNAGRRPSPSGRSFLRQPLELRRELTYPSGFAEVVEMAADDAGLFHTVDGGELDELLHHVDSLAGAGGAPPGHRVLGHASGLQYDPVGPGCSLLLQLDAPDDGVRTGALPSDSSMYWWLRDADLAAGRWHRALWEEQCG